MQLLLVSLSALFALTAGPATAAPDADSGRALEVSTDGVTWRESITDPLFDPEVRWVPGDVREADFYVRNTMPDRGALDVVLSRAASTALFDTGDLAISARADDGAWRTIAPGTSTALLDDAVVDSRPVHVRLRVAFDAASPNMSMVLDTDLDLDLRLAQASAVLSTFSFPLTPDAAPDGAPSTPTHSLLPDTGSALRPWLLPLALLLLGCGAVLAARRTHDEDPS